MHPPAVRCSLGDEIHSDVARAGRSVLDDRLLAERLGQPLCQRARERIGDAAGRGRDYDPDRLGRISLGKRWRHAEADGTNDRQDDA